MNKFGLLDDEASAPKPQPSTTISDRIAAFPPIRSRGLVDLQAMDAAAATHGFISRDPSGEREPSRDGRRRRAIPTEPTRHLAIRLTTSAYERFVAYADQHKLTYHEALIRLLDVSGE